jgi:hypothetical protein
VRAMDQLVDASPAWRRPCPAAAGRAGRPACRAGAAPRARRGRRGSSTRARRPGGRRCAARCGRPAAGASRRCRACAITLMRDTTSGASARCGASTSRSTPSMRKRTTRRFSNGSMWMSEAFSFTASVSSALISRMIGASSSLSSRSSGSGSELHLAACCGSAGSRAGSCTSRPSRRDRLRRRASTFGRMKTIRLVLSSCGCCGCGTARRAAGCARGTARATRPRGAVLDQPAEHERSRRRARARWS